MLAYTNTIHTKQSAIALAKLHQDADNFRQGFYFKDGKGCSVGCMVKDYKEKNDVQWHEGTEPLFGIPRQLSYLQDRIFESLPINEAKKWTLRFMDAIHEGADLSMIPAKLVYWLLTDPDGLRKHARADGLQAIEGVAELYQKKINGELVTTEQWLAARSEAKKVAFADAFADAFAVADAFADAFAFAFADAFAVADAFADAFAVADAVAFADAVAVAFASATAFRMRVADKLIELLENA